MNRTGTIEGGAQLTGSLTAISTITGEISGNSKSLEGTLSTHPKQAPEYTGDYIVTPKAFEDQTLETMDKILTDNVVVLKVPKWETANPSGGKTIFIAEE